MQTLGPLLANPCPDFEFLMQFPSKTLLGRFPPFQTSPPETPTTWQDSRHEIDELARRSRFSA
jgi:hypothetical protein